MTREQITYVWRETDILFSGSTKDVIAWLKEHVHEKNVTVQVELPGGSSIPVQDYLRAVRMNEEVAEHARLTTVFQLVLRAMRWQDRATFNGDTDDMDLVAKQTAEEINKLYKGE